jgi:hypothetical protein
MTVFIEKSPVTSSDCYKTIKTASILIKLGTNIDLTIAFVTLCSVFNFLLPWQRWDISKLQKLLFCVNFFHFSVATYQWIETESNPFQRWLHVTL